MSSATNHDSIALDFQTHCRKLTEDSAGLKKASTLKERGEQIDQLDLSGRPAEALCVCTSFLSQDRPL